MNENEQQTFHICFMIKAKTVLQKQIITNGVDSEICREKLPGNEGFATLGIGCIQYSQVSSSANRQHIPNVVEDPKYYLHL